MATHDITGLGAATLSELIASKRCSCREVMTEFLDRIDECNPALNALVSLRDRDELMAEAGACDEDVARGNRRGWLHGLPLAVKDLSETRGLRTTWGSPIFRDHVPAHDSLMVARMRAHGCVIIGKTNAPEFGLGSHTFNEVFGATRNPYDLTRSCGGSSGGAAVGLATGMLPVADGSDYMGSLRNPAAWNNVFGFRPSQGRVPSHPQPDQYLAQLATDGPMGRSVLDVAMLLGTQAGHDRRAPLSLDGDLAELTDVLRARSVLDSTDPAGLRIGWLADLGDHLATEAGVLDACERGLGRLEQLGCEVEPVSPGWSPEEVWDAWVVWRHHALASGIGTLLAEPSRRMLAKPELLWEVDRGRALDPLDLARAARSRTAFHLSMLDLFDSFDALILPSAQVWPFPIEERWPQQIGDRVMDTYHRWMEVTIYATFAGLPAMSVPVGFGPTGLPMGMQLIGPPRSDVAVLRLAHAYEQTIGDLGVGTA